MAIEIHTETLPTFGASARELLCVLSLLPNFQWWILESETGAPRRFDLLSEPLVRRAHVFGMPVDT